MPTDTFPDVPQALKDVDLYAELDDSTREIFAGALSSFVDHRTAAKVNTSYVVVAAELPLFDQAKHEFVSDLMERSVRTAKYIEKKVTGDLFKFAFSDQIVDTKSVYVRCAVNTEDRARSRIRCHITTCNTRSAARAIISLIKHVAWCRPGAKLTSDDVSAAPLMHKEWTRVHVKKKQKRDLRFKYQWSVTPPELVRTEVKDDV